MVVVESAILRRGSGDPILMTYDPEKDYDFVTGEGNQPIPRKQPNNPYYFPDKPIIPRGDAMFDGLDRLNKAARRPSLWQRFLDWWVG